MKKLVEKMRTLPEKSGCYLMKDIDGTIIYVGKAIHLKKRVNQYFNRIHDRKTSLLVRDIQDFETIVTDNEKEALILEYNLIKKYNPKYNIIFKDDKSYPYIHVSDEKYFRVTTKRLRANMKVKGRLFGPYPNAFSAKQVVDLINKIFPIRKCKTMPNELCLEYHLKQCLGFCVYKFEDSILEQLKQKVIKFLKGDYQSTLDELIVKRDRASSLLQFELAKDYQDLIQAIYYVFDYQAVEISDRDDLDFFHYYLKDSYLVCCILSYRSGKLLNKTITMHRYYGDYVDELINFINNYYKNNLIPKYLIIDQKDILEEINRYMDIPLLFTQRGEKKKIVEKAYENAKQHFIQNTKIVKAKDEYHLTIQKSFYHLFQRKIKRIELFDNSHFYGKDTVGAMVVYQDFKPLKSAYRRYKLDESFDDLKSMHELLYRRYLSALENQNFPDLIIVDGGKNQITVAKEVLQSLAIDIPIVGLVKDEKHNTFAMMDSDYSIVDLNNFKELFLFLTSMQDEVHRFALQYNEKLRKKRLFNQELLSIEGLGEKRLALLLKEFKGIQQLKNATLDQICAVVPAKIAEKVYNYFR